MPADDMNMWEASENHVTTSQNDDLGEQSMFTMLTNLRRGDQHIGLAFREFDRIQMQPTPQFAAHMPPRLLHLGWWCSGSDRHGDGQLQSRTPGLQFPFGWHDRLGKDNGAVVEQETD